MEFLTQFQALCQSEKRRWFLLVGGMAVTHILLQSLLLPYGNALRSLLANEQRHLFDESTAFRSSLKNSIIWNPLSHNLSDIIGGSVPITQYYTETEISDLGSDIKDNGRLKEGEKGNEFAAKETKPDNLSAVVVDGDGNGDLELENDEELNEARELEQVEDDEFVILEHATETEDLVKKGQTMNPGVEISSANHSIGEDNPLLPVNERVESGPVVSVENETYSNGSVSNAKTSLSSPNQGLTLPLPRNNPSKPAKRKMRCDMPPKSVTTIDEMNKILLRHCRSSRAMRPRWSSQRDEEILAARSQIENAPDASNPELHAPIFRNVSMFKRSYELMERMLKVYVYREGKRPIFHTPILKGLYASEGWFMKLMESNRHYVVKQPRRAHLFYMPFSSRMLEYTLYVRNSHNRTNLRQFMKDYTEKISAKYPYFNRTGGADHFLVACHDWAPYETRHHMEHCTKALCNADVTVGFKIGRDVSLPETYVRSARNPLRDLGGKPPSQRNILAFYAGSMHGYLRPILLKYWKDKDPEMKIFGPMPRGVDSKMNYIQHMKSSRYCICPKGYEVNSPRVVESIFYECVPVIISDNFVPPFFDVLNWSAFSVILPEKDIPKLKQVLLSIPEERYLEMQLAVRKAQRHFVWHAKPERYDLFHMTLHSIWYNRVFQIKRR